MSATNARGQVLLSTDAAPKLGVLQLDKGTMNSSESIIMSLAAGMEHTWRSKPLGPTAHLFRPISNIANSNVDFEWTSLVVEVVGGDTTSAIPYLSIEYVINIEFTIRSGTTSALTGGQTQLMRPPAPANTLAIKAADRAQVSISSFISGGISEAEKFLSNKASAALDDVLSEGMAFLGLL